MNPSSIPLSVAHASAWTTFGIGGLALFGSLFHVMNKTVHGIHKHVRFGTRHKVDPDALRI